MSIAGLAPHYGNEVFLAERAISEQVYATTVQTCLIMFEVEEIRSTLRLLLGYRPSRKVRKVVFLSPNFPLSAGSSPSLVESGKKDCGTWHACFGRSLDAAAAVGGNIIGNGKHPHLLNFMKDVRYRGC